MSNTTEKTPNSRPLIKKEHRNKVLITLFLLTALAGGGYWAVIAATSSSAPPVALALRLAYIAVLYMPVPLYTLLLSRFMLGIPVPFRALLSLRRITAKKYALVAGLFLAGCGQRLLGTWQRLMDTWCTTSRSLSAHQSILVR